MKNLSQITEAIDFMKTAKALEDYAKKSGGIDKESFQKVAAYVREIGKNSSTMVQNKAFTAMKKFIGGMDTDPRDGVLQILQKHGMFKNGRLMQEAVSPAQEMKEDGHNDVESMKNKIKTAMSALQKMNTELGKLGDQDSLPTWWTNKVAVAVDKLDGMADYIDTQVESVDEGLKVGDKVKFKKGIDPKTARSYGDAIRKSGKVVKDYGDGDVKVNFGGNNDKSVDAKLLVKEAVSPAQQAAIAISKKERGEKPKNECADEDDFKPHMMYDPKTGKGYKANKYADHVRMDKMGYTHEKPTMKERKVDPADVDNDATDDDRKAADKNVVMQIRKAADLEKGSDIEFKDGKKGKLSQADAKKLTNMFNTLKRPADKEKFQKVVSKDLRSVKALLKRLGR
jgi:hypothetical protein